MSWRPQFPESVRETILYANEEICLVLVCFRTPGHGCADGFPGFLPRHSGWPVSVPGVCWTFSRGHVLVGGLFKEAEEEDVCGVVLTDHFAPTVVRQGTRWAASQCISPAMVSVSCLGALEARVAQPRETLDGVGVLRLASGCQAASQDSSIPRYRPWSIKWLACC